MFKCASVLNGAYRCSKLLARRVEPASAPSGILSRLMQHTNASQSGERGRATRALDFSQLVANLLAMKKLVLALLIASPAYAQTPEWRAIMRENGVNDGCYITAYNTKPVTLCRGQQGWNPEVQQLFQSFSVNDSYTNSFGVTRTLVDDLRQGIGMEPWVRNFLLKEYEKRGVKF